MDSGRTFSHKVTSSSNTSAKKGKFFSFSKASKAETISTLSGDVSRNQQQPSQTQATDSAQGSLKKPVKLEEPISTTKRVTKHDDMARQQHHQLSIESLEADQFIEQLMREAETDPKLRELTYGADRRPPPQLPTPPLFAPESKVGGSTGAFKLQQQRGLQRPPLNESFPLVKRPFRTQQDLIIRSREDDSDVDGNIRNINANQNMRATRHKLTKRPYRTNEDLRITDLTAERSRSADGRLVAMSGLVGAGSSDPFKRQDPKLSSLLLPPASASSTVCSNQAGQLLNEVVTDKEHHSVKDLVAMIEANTMSESINPYVRKWGCDLISTEPHSRGITCRRQRKEMPKPFVWKRSVSAGCDRGYDGVDDEVVNGHDIEHLHENGFFELSAHVADMDDLLGRVRHFGDDEDDSGHFSGNHRHQQRRGFEAVDEERRRRTGTAATSPQRQAPQESSPTMATPPPPMLLLTTADLRMGAAAEETSGNLKAAAAAAASLSEIDRQIATIQTEFEAELDTLIDTYRKQGKQQLSAETKFKATAHERQGIARL